MARPTLPPEQRKQVFNAKIDPEKQRKLRVIAFRKSVISCTKYSQGEFLEDAIDKARMPRKPTPAELARYRETYPNAEHEEPKD